MKSPILNHLDKLIDSKSGSFRNDFTILLDSYLNNLGYVFAWRSNCSSTQIQVLLLIEIDSEDAKSIQVNYLNIWFQTDPSLELT
jgi:hypothetical protein